MTLLSIPRIIRRLSRAAGSSVAGGVMALGIGTAAARLMTLITMMYTARALGTEAFGLLTFGTSAMAYASVMVGPGLRTWGVREISADRSRLGSDILTINAIQLLLAAVSYGGLWLFAAQRLTGNEQRIVYVSGLGLFGIAMNVDWIAQATQSFRWLGLCQVIIGAFGLIGTLALVSSPRSVYAVPVIMLAAQVLGSVILLGLVLREHRPEHWNFGLRKIGVIVRDSIPLGVSAAMVTILHYANNLTLQFYHGTAALGRFGLAYRLFELISVVPSLLSSVFLPRLARLWRTERERAVKEMGLYIRIVLSLACLPAAILVLDGREVSRLAFGSTDPLVVDVLRILGVALIFNFAVVMYALGIIVASLDRVYVFGIFITMLVSLVGGFTLVPALGVWGAAVTVAVLDLVTCAVFWKPFVRVMGSGFLREWRRPLAAGAAGGACLLLGERCGIAFPLRASVCTILYSYLVIPRSALVWARGMAGMASGD